MIDETDPANEDYIRQLGLHFEYPYSHKRPSPPYTEPASYEEAVARYVEQSRRVRISTLILVATFSGPFITVGFGVLASYIPILFLQPFLWLLCALSGLATLTCAGYIIGSEGDYSPLYTRKRLKVAEAAVNTASAKAIREWRAND